MGDRYRFGPFRLDPSAGRLWRGDERIVLPSRAFDTLVYLISHRGDVVEKDALIQAVWKGTFVSDDSLVHCISVLRRALGDDAEHVAYIETVPRRGYRFVAEADAEGDPQRSLLRADTPTGDIADTSLGAAITPPSAHTRGWRRRAVVSAAALGMGAVLAAIVARTTVGGRSSSPPASAVRLTQLPPDGTVLASGGILSPNGRLLAFVARDRPSGVARVWLRTLDSPAAVPVEGTEGASKPFWAPDSARIGFFAGDKLRVVDLQTGDAKAVANVLGPTGGTWAANDLIVFGDTSKGLSLVAASGGAVTSLTTVDASQDSMHAWPCFLPDGRHFVFTILSWNPDRAGIWAGAVGTADVRRISPTPSPAIYSASAYLIYVERDTLVATPFDPTRLKFSGAPLQVAQNVHIPRIGEDEMFSVSDTLLSLRSGLKREHFAWFGRDGEEHDPIDGPTPLFNPALSPDGRTLAANGGPSREPGLWLIDLNARVATRIHSEAIGPIWSPDGRELAFTARGGLEIRRRATTGPTEEVLLLHDSARKVLQDWSPDGRYLVYSTMSDAGGVDLWMLPSSGASPPTPLMTTPANERQAQISPDGKWIAYTSDESGRPEVYIQTFPGLGTKRAVSADGGTTPFWRRDGRELFYLSAAGQLYAVPLHLGDGVSVGPPLLLFRVPRGLDASAARNVYVPAPDGETFLFNVTDENTEHAAITVIVNWRAQLAVSRTATPAADRPRTAWAATSRRPLPSGTTRS